MPGDRAVSGAQVALEQAKKGQLNPDPALTREALEVYRAIAQKVANHAGNSGQQLQQIRLEIIDLLIEQGKI